MFQFGGQLTQKVCSFHASISLGAASQGNSYTKAYALAQKNMESIYYLKENDLSWDWVNGPETNSDFDYYQPQINATSTTLGPKISGDGYTSGDGYKVKVKVLPVFRDTAGNLKESLSDPLDYIDDNSRKILVSVSWKEKGVPTDVTLVSLLTNH